MRILDHSTDLGESFGAWKMGTTKPLLEIVTFANIACGYEAGDPLVMDRTGAEVQLASLPAVLSARGDRGDAG